MVKISGSQVEGAFCLPGDICNVWRYFALSWLGLGSSCYSLIAGRGQGCGWTSCSAGDSPHPPPQKNVVVWDWHLPDHHTPVSEPRLGEFSQSCDAEKMHKGDAYCLSLLTCCWCWEITPWLHVHPSLHCCSSLWQDCGECRLAEGFQKTHVILDILVWICFFSSFSELTWL